VRCHSATAIASRAENDMAPLSFLRYVTTYTDVYLFKSVCCYRHDSYELTVFWYLFVYCCYLQKYDCRIWGCEWMLLQQVCVWLQSSFYVQISHEALSCAEWYRHLCANGSFEIIIFDLLFDYEVWRRLCEVLCIFGAKNSLCNCKIAIFWGTGGGWYPFLVKTPKSHFPSRKHSFWCIDRWDRSRNATCSRYEESKKEKKPKDVTNRLFAKTTHVEIPPPDFSCGVGLKLV